MGTVAAPAPHLVLADVVLVIALMVVAPAYSYYAGLRIARGTFPNRTAAYVRTIVSWSLVTLTMLYVWHYLGRPFTALGLRVPADARSLAGAVLCILALAYMNGQLRVIRRLSSEKLAAVERTFGRMAAVLPRTLPEYRWFLAVSLTAGVCEELLFRGYFFAVATPYVTLFGALGIGGVVFGLGHAYQGVRGIAKTAIVGLLLGLVYIATGSLIWPMILHVLIDVQGGTVAYRVLRRTDRDRL